MKLGSDHTVRDSVVATSVVYATSFQNNNRIRGGHAK